MPMRWASANQPNGCPFPRSDDCRLAWQLPRNRGTCHSTPLGDRQMPGFSRSGDRARIVRISQAVTWAPQN